MLVGADMKTVDRNLPEWISGSYSDIHKSVIEDFEGGRSSDKPAARPWQSQDSTTGGWFYDPYNGFMRPEVALDHLVSTVARNGCLLLNIGLRADGSLSDPDKLVLAGLTRFMATNSESIHGTRPWIVWTDRPSGARFTTKGDSLYAIFLKDWPGRNGPKVVIRALTPAISPWVSSINKVEVLGSANPVTFAQTPEGLSICRPSRPSRPTFKPLSLRSRERGRR